MSLDPAPNITAGIIGDKNKDDGSIEDKWSGLDEGPVRKIPWIDLKTLTGAQKKEVFLKGTFERICPLRYECTFNKTNKISIFEQNENLKITFPGSVTDNFGDWNILKVTAMIGSKSNVFIFDGSIRHGMVEVPFRIPNNLFGLEYQYDILYTAATKSH